MGHRIHIKMKNSIHNTYVLFYLHQPNERSPFYQQLTDMSTDPSTETDTNFNYYHEYCRLHLANVVLMSQMRELVNQRNQLSTRFIKLEKKGEEIQEGEKSEDNRKKRFRRTADEIQRHYRCPVDTCQRSYGSQGSLNQHLKLKHHELYQKMGIGRSQHGDQSHFSQSVSKRPKIDY